MSDKDAVRVVVEVDGYPAKTVAFDGVMPTLNTKGSLWHAFWAKSIGGTSFVMAGWARNFKDKRCSLKRGDLVALVSHPGTPEFAVGIPVKFLRDLNSARREEAGRSFAYYGIGPRPFPVVWVSNAGAGSHLGLPIPYVSAFEHAVAPEAAAR